MASRKKATPLTASDTKLIISRVADFKTVASQILKKDDSLDFIPAVKYGLEHEDYIRYIVQQRNPQNVVRQTGLVIHPLEQYIAASPDGLIRSGEDYMLMEIKCIFNPKGHSVQELICNRPDFCLMNSNGIIALKNSQILLSNSMPISCQ
ncbi:SWIM-type domain-containing protein [Trichonephila clavipes]|nr:SWIM-type domain-containing protein [Trichonephila clavipes]